MIDSQTHWSLVPTGFEYEFCPWRKLPLYGSSLVIGNLAFLMRVAFPAFIALKHPITGIPS